MWELLQEQAHNFQIWDVNLQNFNIDGRYRIDKVDIVEFSLPVSWQQSK